MKAVDIKRTLVQFPEAVFRYSRFYRAVIITEMNQHTGQSKVGVLSDEGEVVYEHWVPNRRIGDVLAHTPQEYVLVKKQMEDEQRAEAERIAAKWAAQRDENQRNADALKGREERVVDELSRIIGCDPKYICVNTMTGKVNVELPGIVAVELTDPFRQDSTPTVLPSNW